MNPRPNDIPPPLDTNTTTTLTTSIFASLHDQYPSNPPPALTVVLSIVCGIVATCILFTVRINTSIHHTTSVLPTYTTTLSRKKNTYCNR